MLIYCVIENGVIATKFGGPQPNSTEQGYAELTMAAGADEPQIGDYLTADAEGLWSVAPLDSPRMADFMAKQIVAAVAKTYTDVDAIYDAAVGSRTSEYALAEEAALAYKAAGYSGVASGFISGYAASNPTGQVQSNQWAADSIIARASAMRSAQLAMRNTRFTCQAGMRAATTPAQLAAVVATWDSFMAGVRAQLGI